MEMVIVDPEDLNLAKMGAIGWIVSLLVIAVIGVVDLLQ